MVNKKKMVNGWKAKNKQSDKVHVMMRVSKLTVLDLYMDLGRKEGRFMIFNFGMTW